MPTDLDAVITAKINSEKNAQFAAVAKSAGKSRGEALRIIIDRTIDEAGLNSQVFKTDSELLDAFKRDLTLFVALSDSVLEKQFSLVSDAHRREIAREVGQDRSLVTVVAKAQLLGERGTDVTDLLVAYYDQYFSDNPGAQIFSAHPDDILELALRNGGLW